jgi:hypothetical protein
MPFRQSRASNRHFSPTRLLFTSIIVLATTMANGLAQSTPIPTAAGDCEIIAEVLGNKITIKDTNRFHRDILAALSTQYAKDHHLEPTDQELQLFASSMKKREEEMYAKMQKDKERLTQELATPNISTESRLSKEKELQRLERMMKQITEIRRITEPVAQQSGFASRTLAQSQVQKWKIDQSLYERYGGRVIFQQAGPEPWDAWRMFLLEEHTKGSFKILKPELEASFWNYHTNQALHRFYPKEEGTGIMRTPFWQQEAGKQN